MNDMLPKDILESIEQIRQDNTSGSIELAKKSVELLIRLVQKTDSLAHIKHTGYSLVQAQPTMASIFNLINNLMFNIDRNKHQHLKHIVDTYCQQFLHDLVTSEISISKLVLERIPNNSVLITHSYSSTILNALLYAKRHGKRFSVICTESRPKNEGLQLARQLGRNQIPVTLIVDSAVFSCIPDADMILVGGDAIHPIGLINKIGTKGIAITAQHHNIPFYALCSTIKFLPPTFPVTLNHQKNPHEILLNQLSNVTPLNFYFDCISLKYLAGVITEDKILKPSEIIKRLHLLKVHPDFALKSSSD